MSLKRNLDVFEYAEIGWFMNEVATRGGIVSVSTGGSGVALSNQGTATSPLPLATYKASSSGALPIGMLLTDVVSIDTTKFHANYHKEEVAKPGKVTIVKKGRFMTNCYVGTPTAYAPAYLASSGFVSTSQNGAANNPRIGTFLGTPSEDGYVHLEVNLPY